MKCQTTRCNIPEDYNFTLSACSFIRILRKTIESLEASYKSFPKTIAGLYSPESKEDWKYWTGITLLYVWVQMMKQVEGVERNKPKGL